MSESVISQQHMEMRNPHLSAVPREWLFRTWCFRLAAFAFVALSTKYIAVTMNGLAGMFVLLTFAVFAGLPNRSLDTVYRYVRRTMRGNQLMVLLVVWYLIGVLNKMYFSGTSDTNWRLVMAPVMLILGMLMGFGFLHEGRCTRFLQIAFIMMVGVQSIFTGMIVLDDPSIVRESVEVTSGGWAYGDQGGFAMQMMLLPVLVWRAFTEKGVLRPFLLACCASIGFTLAISQFATAFGLLLLSFPITLLLAIRYIKHKARLAHILTIICIGGIGFFIFQTMHQSPLLANANRHIVNVWNDPTSGGYDEKYWESSRWHLAQISLNTFQNNPFFGAGEGSVRNYNLVGGHSALFDMLGFYGLLGGGGAFVAMLLLMLRRALRRLRRQRDWEMVATATSVVLLLIGGVVNPFWEGDTTVMVLLLGRLFRLPREPA